MDTIDSTNLYHRKNLITIGHRGAAGYEPENTLASFAKALELGVDMIELDVHLSKYSDLIVIHDPTVDRTTNGIGLVSDKSLIQIKELHSANGEKIPTLEEVCDLVNRRIPINIEIKERGTAPFVAKLIQYYIDVKNWSYNDFLVSSFDHSEILAFHKLMPEAEVMPLLEYLPIDYENFLNVWNTKYVGISHDQITQSFIDYAHSKNMKVFVYTVDDFDDIAHVKKFGIDGIFSNYPDRVKNL